MASPTAVSTPSAAESGSAPACTQFLSTTSVNYICDSFPSSIPADTSVTIFCYCACLQHDMDNRLQQRYLDKNPCRQPEHPEVYCTKRKLYRLLRIKQNLTCSLCYARGYCPGCLPRSFLRPYLRKLGAFLPSGVALLSCRHLSGCLLYLAGRPPGVCLLPCMFHKALS